MREPEILTDAWVPSYWNTFTKTCIQTIDYYWNWNISLMVTKMAVTVNQYFAFGIKLCPFYATQCSNTNIYISYNFSIPFKIIVFFLILQKYKQMWISTVAPNLSIMDWASLGHMSLSSLTFALLLLFVLLLLSSSNALKALFIA